MNSHANNQLLSRALRVGLLPGGAVCCIQAARARSHTKTGNLPRLRLLKGNDSSGRSLMIRAMRWTYRSKLLPVGDNRSVPPVLDKLHHLFPGSGDRGPSRLGFGVLLNTNKRVAVNGEDDLPKHLGLAARDEVTLSPTFSS